MASEYKYIVGYVGSNNRIVYGRKNSFANLCTLHQAKRELETLRSKHPKTIYELKPISNLAVKVRLKMLVKAK